MYIPFASSFDFLFFLGLLCFFSSTTTTFSSIGTIGSVTTAAAGIAGVWSTSSTSSVSSILILFFLALVFLGVGSAEDDEVGGFISGSGTANFFFVKSKHSYEY